MDPATRPAGARRSLVILALALAGCMSGASTSPASSPPSQPPTLGPSPSTVAFDLTVEPATFVGSIFNGSPVVLLATVSGTEGDGAVRLQADAPGGTAGVEPAVVMPGHVAEVTVSPPPCSSGCENRTTEITISAVRGEVRKTVSRSITVVPEASRLEPEARAHLAPFIAWLAASRPDLGITATTEWRGVPGSWVLIVEHYLFFSSDWELDLSWHVMVPPNDWSRIDLRRRGTEVAPSLAFQIDSVAGKSTPHEIDPLDAIWR